MDIPNSAILDSIDEIEHLSDLDVEALRDIHPELAIRIDEQYKDQDYE